ncbi:restriction endonuclease subunit S [Aeromonas caviae]|uniref:restriction endonuclease subunit S n=1 Tax=Aeromonas caviae TaxID=648 RepID=UPI0022515B3A|nr:restriction endonuclease subunit S [Aeromonas caviae]MCX4036819.1 restriction endonuclease subunit S [Aeromonas caviae]
MKWPMVKLEELATHIRNGVSVKQSPNAGGLKITRIETIAERKVNLNKCGYADLTENDYMDFRLKKGDILISHINSESHLGKCAIFEEERNDIVHGMNLLSFRTNRKVEPKYLYYALSSDSFLMKLKKITKKSVNQASFNVTSFKELDIPLPPLEEQKRIAAILDKADAIRQKRQQAITLADQFLRSVFLDMFGDPVTNPKEWDIYPLKKGITNITAGWSANGENHSCGDDEIGVLKISAVTSGIFKPNENKVVSSSSIPSNKKLVLPRKGDLLFSRANTRELVGATCIVDSDYDNIFLPDKLWVINLNSNELLPEYVHMLIQHPKFKECLTSQATGSSGSMLNISKAKFEGTLAPYPSLDVQQRFKDIFWKVMTCNALTNDSKINFDNQFNALSQKAFSGQL